MFYWNNLFSKIINWEEYNSVRVGIGGSRGTLGELERCSLGFLKRAWDNLEHIMSMPYNFGGVCLQ